MLEVIRPDSGDAELPEFAEARAHLSECAACRRAFEVQQQVDREITRAMRAVTVPPELKARIRSQLALVTTLRGGAPSDVTSAATASSTISAAFVEPPPAAVEAASHVAEESSASPTTPPVLTPQVPAAPTVVPPIRSSRRISRRQLATVVAACLLVTTFAGGGWFFLSRVKPVIGVENLVAYAHQLPAEATLFQKSVDVVLPERELRVPDTQSALPRALSVQFQQQEIGAAVQYQLTGSRGRNLTTVLLVVDLRRIVVPDLDTVAHGFVQATPSYPPPNFFATRVWQSGNNLYVCYVISKFPQDLESLARQTATT